jgi:hypothetical protein
MTKQSFVLRTSLHPIIGKLSDEQAGMLFKAVLQYAADTLQPSGLEGATAIAFDFIKQDIDNASAKYEQVCAKRKEAIQKRWANTNVSGSNSEIQMNTNVYTSIQKNTKDTNVYKPIHNDNDNEDDNDNDIKKEINKEKKYPPLFDEFWSVYPKQRIGNKDKAASAFEAAIKRTHTKAEEIVAKAKEYAASDEVARGFAKGAQAWLNDDRYLRSYGLANNVTGTTLEEARRKGTQVIRDIFGGGN